jgi:hypothetical protein
MRHNPLLQPRDRDWLVPSRPWPSWPTTCLMLAYQLAGTPSAADTAMILWCVWFFLKTLLWARG